MRLRRTGLILAGVAAVVVLAAYIRPQLQPADHTAWLADFEQLQREVRSGYANLEWSIDRNEIDLRELEADTEQAIRSARTRQEAQEALQSYVSAFGDGHFRLVPPQSKLVAQLEGWWTGRDAQILEADMSGKTACRALGYENRDVGFRLAFEKLDEFEVLPQKENPFEAGVLSLADGRRLGVIRLAHFGEDGYRNTCARAWAEFRETLSGSCDEACQDRFRSAVSNRLLRELEERVESVADAAPDGLVVDVTANGGGSNFADAAARVFTPVALHGPKLAFVRHPHWSHRFGPMLEVIERDLANDDLTRSQHALLNEAAARVQKLAETGHECADRGETTDGLSGDCSDLVRGEYFATGVLSYAPRGDLEGLESGEKLFSPSGYEYREGRYDGPLFVLQNRGTASAAEYFAAVLKDNGAATLIGSRTVGVGCGYTNGGLDVVLSNSKIRVWMPDCVRLRPDGSNEADGVAPDVEAGWSDDDSNTELAAKVVSVLERLSTSHALQ